MCGGKKTTRVSVLHPDAPARAKTGGFDRRTRHMRRIAAKVARVNLTAVLRIFYPTLDARGVNDVPGSRRVAKILLLSSRVDRVTVGYGT